MKKPRFNHKPVTRITLVSVYHEFCRMLFRRVEQHKILYRSIYPALKNK